MSIFSHKFLSTFASITLVSENPQIHAYQANDFFKLWIELEKNSGRLGDVPFWAITWTAARSFCHFIGSNLNLVKGKSILDLGCGCGIVGISVKVNGAVSVTLNDIDPQAMYISQINAKINGVKCYYLN